MLYHTAVERINEEHGVSKQDIKQIALKLSSSLRVWMQSL